MTPVWNGSDSSRSGLPSSDTVMPAPSRSATASTSSTASAAPCPTSIATCSPASSTRAARVRSSSAGSTRDLPATAAVCTTPWLCCSVVGEVGALHVVGDDHAGGGRRRERRADGVVEHERELLGRGEGLDVLPAHVLEQGGQVDLLQVAAAQGGGDHLPDDRDHRLAVELRVVEAVEEVDRARALGRQAHADLARVLGVAGRHERRHLLVPRRDELDPVRGPVERREDRVDPVPGVAEDAGHTPVGEPSHQSVRDGAHAVGRGCGVSGDRHGASLCRDDAGSAAGTTPKSDAGVTPRPTQGRCDDPPHRRRRRPGAHPGRSGSMPRAGPARRSTAGSAPRGTRRACRRARRGRPPRRPTPTRRASRRCRRRA